MKKMLLGALLLGCVVSASAMEYQMYPSGNYSSMWYDCPITVDPPSATVQLPDYIGYEFILYDYCPGPYGWGYSYSIYEYMADYLQVYLDEQSIDWIGITDGSGYMKNVKRNSQGLITEYTYSYEITWRKKK